MSRITTMERVERSLAAVPALSVMVDPGGRITARNSTTDVAWRLDFDERGRFIEGHRILRGRPAVIPHYVRTLKTILASLGAPT